MPKGPASLTPAQGGSLCAVRLAGLEAGWQMACGCPGVTRLQAVVLRAAACQIAVGPGAGQHARLAHER
jgi:hypothetical protein